MFIAYLISRRLFAPAVEPKFVERLFGTGYCATVIMFLAGNMWLFLGSLALLSVLAARRFTYPLALFVFLLLLMPGYSVQVPGFGLINYLIEVNPWRLLSFTLLLPAAFLLSSQKHLPKPGILLADKLVLGFALYTSWLTYLHYGTFTGGLRHLAITTLDSLLIYFVASRGLMLKGAVRHVMVALVIATIFLALVGSFEFFKRWLLYSSLKNSLGISSVMFGYLGRGDTLRAIATTGQPIVLGFVMMVGLLTSMYVHKLVEPGLNRLLLWCLMGMGLLAAMSRGPWVGALLGLVAITLCSARPMVKLFKLMLTSVATAVLLVLLPGGEKIIDYLPWVGTVDAFNVTYREMLWDQTQLVIGRHFWFGSVGYTELPEFDELRLGSGLVDIVNSYLGVVLSFGIIGLCLYSSLIMVTIFQNVRQALLDRKKLGEQAFYSPVLTGILVSAAITIVTVSSISQIAPLLIFLIGAGVANICLVTNRVQRVNLP
jgi:hypothetical protein